MVYFFFLVLCTINTGVKNDRFLDIYLVYICLWGWVKRGLDGLAQTC